MREEPRKANIEYASHLIEELVRAHRQAHRAPPGTSPLGPAALRRGGTAPSFRRGAASFSGVRRNTILIAETEL